ncbi:MAG: helix-hairpin-helix domain-containing protein [Synergistaceae bacterium]|jgi:competence protein ComEA|nr:helix-hairpin-helix domain-containing protein [Synergistaceae bacterium]
MYFERGGWGERKQFIFLVSGAIAAVLAFALVIVLSGKFSAARVTSAPDDFAEFSEAADEKPKSDGNWVVYVTGCVMRPGVYEVPPGSRINDAVSTAGGFSAHADPEGVNLAEKIEDGAHIRIPERSESFGLAPGNNPDAFNIAGRTPPSASAPPGAGVVSRPTRSQGSAAAGKNIRENPNIVDINSAAAEELQSLPGIGPRLSEAIVEFRETSGPFVDVSDIMNVKGIGQKRFEAIRDLITVSR